MTNRMSDQIYAFEEVRKGNGDKYWRLQTRWDTVCFSAVHKGDTFEQTLQRYEYAISLAKTITQTPKS